MLNEAQLDELWRDMLAAETRSYYFADLAQRVTRRKQWITGSILLLSSGAAVSLMSEMSRWVASSMSLVVAGLTVYTVSTGLDGQTLKLQDLHSAWSRIHDDYRRLWSHTFEESAEAELEAIRERERDASARAATGVTTNAKLVGKWQDRVNALHSPKGQNAA
ncbi:MAG: hypothetical protein ACTHJX_05200 [Terriglobales bacterium]